MIAVNFFNYIKSQFNLRNARKGVSLSLITVILFNPITALVYAADYNMENRVGEARDYVDYLWNEEGYGASSNWSNNTSVFSSDGTSYTFTENGEEKTIPISDLFQAKNQDTSFRDQYQLEDVEFQQNGKDNRDTLQNSDSASGAGYDILRESAYMTKPDVSNDPLWASSEAVFGTLTGENPFDSNACSDGSDHVPDYRTCESVNMLSGVCEVNHYYEIEPVMVPEGGFVNFSTCGENCVTLWIGKPDAESNYAGNCTIFEEDVTVRMANPDAIVRATLTNADVDDYVQFWKVNEDGSKVSLWESHSHFPPESIRWNGSQYNKWETPDMTFNGHSFDEMINSVYFGRGNLGGSATGSCERKSSDVFRPNKDLTSILKDNSKGDNVKFLLRTSVAGTGEGYIKINVYYDPMKLVKTDFWGDPDCIARAQIYAQNTNTSSFVQCVDMPEEVQSDGCYTVSGTKVCPSNMQTSLLPNIGSPFCRKYGVEQPDSYMPYTSSGVSDCSDFESNPKCGFIKSTCADSTPAEQAQDLFEFGLARQPSSSEYQYWYAKLLEANDIDSDIDYDEVRTEFFSWAESNNEPIINTFSCKVFEETWDCGYPEGGYSSGACAIKGILENDFSECEMEMVPTTEPQTVYTTSTETCEEALSLTECSIERDISITDRSQNRELSIAGCISEQEVSVQIPWANNAISASSRYELVSNQHITFNITQQPSEANDWTVKGVFKGDAYLNESTGLIECSEGSYISGRLVTTGKSIVMQETNIPAPGEESNNPCLRETDSYTTTNWVCEEYQSMSDGNWANAISPISSQLPVNCVKAKATYDTRDYGYGELCWTGYNGQTGCDVIDENSGALEVGTNNCGDLEAREQQGECTYIGRFPIEGSTGSEDAQFNYLWEHRYDCIDGEYQTDPEMVPQYTCEGIVSCMGTECMDPDYQQSDDFGKAAGMLQVLQNVDGDMDCTTAADGTMSNCKVFSGEAQTCQQALGSYIDCCEPTANGPTLTDYIKSYTVSKRMENYVFNENMFDIQSSAYGTIRNGITDSYDTVSEWAGSAGEAISNTVSDYYDKAASYAGETFGQLFSTSADSVVSSTASSVTSSISSAYDAMSLALEEFKKEMMTQARDFLSEAFGDQVAEMFITSGGGMGTVMTSIVSVVGWIYAAYQIANLIAQLYFKCTTEMIGLASEIPLKKTHYVGSYCTMKAFWGDCLEKQQSYCVFESPLSRILNEQIRPQLGRGWGTPKNPDCSGIGIEDLTTVDWNQVDLTEWMDILNVTDNAPNYDNINLDTMTGKDSFLGQNLGDPEGSQPSSGLPTTDYEGSVGEERLNTAERNIERLEGTSLDEARDYSSDKLWSQF